MNGDWLSRRLSHLLRHGATRAGISIDAQGWVYASDVLRLRDMQGVSLEQIINEVMMNPKQRYEMTWSGDELKIRATQGHTMNVVNDSMHQRITRASDVVAWPDTEVVHGTFLDAWDSIRAEGLRTMGRQHVHLTTGLPGSGGPISGMRKECDVAIWIDIGALLDAGIDVYRSANGVILTAGEDGVISPRFFTRVCWLGPPEVALWSDGRDNTDSAMVACQDLREAAGSRDRRRGLDAGTRGGTSFSRGGFVPSWEAACMASLLMFWESAYA